MERPGLSSVVRRSRLGASVEAPAERPVEVGAGGFRVDLPGRLSHRLVGRKDHTGDLAVGCSLEADDSGSER